MLLNVVILWWTNRSWWTNRPARFAFRRARNVTGRVAIIVVMISAITAATSVAEERHGRESMAILGSDHGSATPSGVVLLREGSRIPPTPGRIVLMGRRWVFIPATNARGDVASASTYPPADRDSAADGFDPSEVRRLFGSVAFTATSDNGGQDGKGTHGQSGNQLVLAENLNLQRIIEAVRADPADENWIVTGQISEFFGENRLTISTAQRSNRE